MNAPKYLKVPQVPNQKIFYPSLQWEDYKISSLIWEHIIILRMSFCWVWNWGNTFSPSGILYNLLKSLILSEQISEMGNFVCQLDWLCSSQIKHYFWIFLWGCFGMTIPFELVASVGRLPYPMWVGIIQSFQGPTRNTGKGSRNWSPFFPASLLSWDTSSHLLWLMGWGGIYTTDFSGSQAFRLRMNYTTDFSGSPVYKWHLKIFSASY